MFASACDRDDITPTTCGRDIQCVDFRSITGTHLVSSGRLTRSPRPSSLRPYFFRPSFPAPCLGSMFLSLLESRVSDSPNPQSVATHFPASSFILPRHTPPMSTSCHPFSSDQAIQTPAAMLLPRSRRTSYFSGQARDLIEDIWPLRANRGLGSNYGFRFAPSAEWALVKVRVWLYARTRT